MAEARNLDMCAVAIAASTGGPAALERVLCDLSQIMGGHAAANRALPPVFITQHMSAPFNDMLAAHMADVCGFDCRAAEAGEPVCRGHVYIAPDGAHLGVWRTAEGIRIRLMQTPPVHFCRPAADPMLESLAKVYGANLLAVILTGMGKDGLTGCGHVAEAGGTIWAQDAHSSVVWGMPGSVAQAGLCQRVLPLESIGQAVAGWVCGGAG